MKLGCPKVRRRYSGLFRYQERPAGILKKLAGIFGVLRMDLQDEAVFSSEQHHGSGDAGGVLVRGEAFDSGGLQSSPGEKILGLALQERDCDPVFGHSLDSVAGRIDRRSYPA